MLENKSLEGLLYGFSDARLRKFSVSEDLSNLFDYIRAEKLRIKIAISGNSLVQMKIPAITQFVLILT